MSKRATKKRARGLGGGNRKVAKALALRIADYERTVATSKKPAGAFHKPGSMQKR